MWKNYATTVGGVLLAGFLLHPGTQVAPDLPPAGGNSNPATTAELQLTGDGPWIASCRYWAPARSLFPEPQPSNESARDSNAGANKPQSNATEAACDGRVADPWGIPSNSGTVQPHITALVAAVPNPLQPQLALEFDRTLDALLQAAADNNYVESYSWLPWKNTSRTGGNSGGSGNEQDAADRTRERQPGLILLKHVPSQDCGAVPGSANSANPESCVASSFDDVIYLFLAGDTPVNGMSGAQLGNAFRYEQILKRRGAKLSLKTDHAQEMDVIGSDSSGAAASMREAVEQAASALGVGYTRVAGATSTALASRVFSGSNKLEYLSFGPDASFQSRIFHQKLEDAGVSLSGLAYLVEDGTAYGAATARDLEQKPTAKTPIVLRFPVGISLLRNAQTDATSRTSTDPNQPGRPYLQFSLRDSTTDGGGSLHFSPDHLPLSQEAQLMAIGRQMRRYHVQFVSIEASNVLDEMYLAKFLHRELPDIRLVSLGGGDLLYEHDVDDIPFLGSLTITPFNLLAPVPSQAPSAGGSTPPLRAFSDRRSQAMYNAASYTFWDGNGRPKLANYRSIFHPAGAMHPSLWVTVIGRDGYYPIDVLDPCASHSPGTLPSFVENGGALTPVPCVAQTSDGGKPQRFPASPPLTWFACCVLVLGLCALHTVALTGADMRSHFTRDLAIDFNDEPRRRALYINIGTTMLFCMAFLVCYPLLPARRLINPDPQSWFAAILTFGAGLGVLIATLRKTRRYILPPRPEAVAGAPCCSTNADRSFWQRTRLYFFFHLVALAALLALLLLWVHYCGLTAETKDYKRLFFSYRCLNPASGVSPLTPILLLLGGWYFWSVIQTRRLRFSITSKPALPRSTGDPLKDLLFVPEEDLGSRSGSSGLYATITSLLITQELARRVLPRAQDAVLYLLAGGYAALLIICLVFTPITSLENLFWHEPRWSSYALVAQALFFPLLMIALTGWARAILTWSALCRTVLWRLEHSPLRLAFSRMNDVGWMAMMRQNGLVQRWREMARSRESMLQLMRFGEVKAALSLAPDATPEKYSGYGDLLLHIRELLHLVHGTPGLGPGSGAAPDREDAEPRTVEEIERHTDPQVLSRFLCVEDVPDQKNRGELLLLFLIEEDYAEFAHVLLERLLIPYWQEKRESFVELDEPSFAASKARDAETGKPGEGATGPALGDPLYIRLAEEFVAIRYLSLIRAVLVNIRHLLTFVSLAFVFSIISWNSYPFRPRAWIDDALAWMLIIIGAGTIWTFAQMHRDPILSRITGTKANELGSDFYRRIVSFGALPVLTWLAYQFPSISSAIMKYLQPGLQAFK